MARQSMPLVWSRAQLEIDVDRSISEFKERRITEWRGLGFSDRSF